MPPGKKETASGQNYRPPVTVYLGLGSNIGDSHAYLQRAIDLLNAHPDIKVERVSPFLETEPVGYLEQPNFLNGVVQAATSLTPQELLAATQSIENKLGRVRTIRWGPRTIDIDILLYGDLILESTDLIIPHPRMLGRAFVLQPLAMLAPELRIPGCPETVRALAQKFQR
ncbi:MAG: 2-amino-4-hydroxy-6-hydroxymethyldihydropteridine diphosphokinase [Dethiobacteria bacterium]|jgi:2-amino-4-hydroxy-6-hydroxymethyldihydropteridine diphosphokinase